MRRDSLLRVCTLLAARDCYESGMSVATLAIQAKRSEKTIRSWLKIAGARKPDRKDVKQ